MLTDTVQELKDEIALLKKSLCTMQSSVEQLPQVAQVRVTTAELDQPGQVTVMDSGTECRKSGGVHNTIVNSNNRSHSSTSLISNYDRKFNIVIYGIEECPKGTPKHRRLDLDHSKVVSELSNIDSSIKDHAIKDCFCLGKFHPLQDKSRPILVKFIRMTDVSCILSKRAACIPPISIKRDMASEERLSESMLLKERWGLVQSGIPKGDIKIKGSRLSVKNMLYGQIQNSSFVHYSPPVSNLPLCTAHRDSMVSNSSMCSEQQTSIVSNSPVGIDHQARCVLSSEAVSDSQCTTRSTINSSPIGSTNVSKSTTQLPSPTTIVPTATYKNPHSSM